MNDPSVELVRIRAARDDDAPAMAVLLAELGHPLEPAQVIAQLRALDTQGGAATLVAEVEGRVLGLVSAQAILVLHRATPSGRITVLVVRDERIGAGIGTKLLRAAESFLRERGCTRIEVTSAPHRTGAHAFYLKRGFRRQPERFAKDVG